MSYVLAALGGALGALGRWGVAVALPAERGTWPWATLVVNLAGCLLIGVLLAVLASRRPEDERLRVFVGAGVLGGFTTFSTFAVEFAALLRAGMPVLAVGYVAASVVGGVVAVAVGIRAAQALGGWRS